MFRTNPHPVYYGVSSGTLHSMESLFSQQLPVGRVCFSQSSNRSPQDRYNGKPVICSINKTFEGFGSKIPNNGQLALFPFITPDLCNESEAVDAFRANVLCPLQSYLNSYRIFRDVPQPPTNLFSPDFQLCDVEDFPFLCVEIKPCNAFCKADITRFDTMTQQDRAEELAKYTPLPEGIVAKRFLKSIKRQKKEGGEKECIGQFNFRLALRRLKVYLYNMRYTEAYGILSTYIHTFFVILKRGQENKSDELLVSPAVKFNDSNILQRIGEFIYKAQTAVRDPILEKEKLILLPLNKTIDSKGQKRGITKPGGKRRKKDEKKCSQNLGRSVSMGNVIGVGRNGSVVELFDEKNQLFAAKLVGDKSKDNIKNELDLELKNEDNIYKILKPLQGDIVPKIYFSGFMEGRHVIVMEYLEAQSINMLHHLSNEQKGAALAALEKIHQLGVLHGDIREENVLMHKCNDKQAYIIDFGFATECNSFKAFAKEKQELKNILGMK
ncbi:uncharacterized protein [Parasteatoda tepidariorum]|uniref:uncharacterized protein n=1 Tax=Parasteatoda tepidariorum TaxID=114398 RepID=UPI00077F8742|nr:uncharacterized protein LOC107448334 [Parasteatoda tepidariorum]XP_015918992.1 uncharacterized protein LOC107448334 [Parasteatoda tepidariorum]XP_042901136.1 uncharacterized protein LOC107448334 [Parasteatoda tepidariorum]